jgi:hypothetical protein
MAKVPTETERIAEIVDLLRRTMSLSEVQKVTAEFWTQSSMPCLLTRLWRGYTHNTTATCITSGLDVSRGMFEISRLAWALKKCEFQSRPIQDIRRLYPDDQTWMPFYDTNTVSPAYPDFPSELSAFAKLFASVMTSYFGNDIPLNAKLIGTIQSRIPVKDIQWKTRTEMAESCGEAVQNAGIHTPSSHIAGQVLADEVYRKITNRSLE